VKLAGRNISYNKQMKKQISEILIKWGLPTRQRMIDEIIQVARKDFASKGGKARAAKMTQEERTAHGRKMSKARKKLSTVSLASKSVV
jgi:hypothetical protein